MKNKKFKHLNPLKYKQKVYSSITKLARHLKIDRHTLAQIIKNTKKNRLDSAINRKVKLISGEIWENGYPKRIKYKNMEYRSYSKLASHIGVNVDTLRRWIKRGRRNDTDFIIENNLKKTDHSIYYRGKRYDSKTQLAKKLNLGLSTIYGWSRKGLSIEEEIKRYKNIRYQRRGIERTKQEDWANNTVQGIVTKWPNVVKNIDFSKAIRFSGKTPKIGKLICKIHGPIERLKSIARIKQGVQPCDKCILVNIKKLDTTKLKRTIERAKEIANKLNLQINMDDVYLKKFSFGKNKRRETKICKAYCLIHHKFIAPTWWVHFSKGIIGCEDCYYRGYSFKKVSKMVMIAHSGRIEIIKYGGNILSHSFFYCKICGRQWEASVNSVIGTSRRSPTGCPDCSKKGSKEFVIGRILKKRGIEYIKQYPVISSKHKKPLYCDYFLPDYKLVIEYDGEQHYIPRGYMKYKEDFEKIKKRDKAKNNILRKMGIKIARVPFFIDSIDSEIVNILDNKPSYTGLPSLKEYKKYIDNHPIRR